MTNWSLTTMSSFTTMLRDELKDCLTMFREISLTLSSIMMTAFKLVTKTLRFNIYLVIFDVVMLAFASTFGLHDDMTGRISRPRTTGNHLRNYSAKSGNVNTNCNSDFNFAF